MKRGYKYKNRKRKEVINTKIEKGKRKEMINEPHKKMNKCESNASLSSTTSLLTL